MLMLYPKAKLQTNVIVINLTRSYFILAVTKDKGWQVYRVKSMLSSK